MVYLLSHLPLLYVLSLFLTAVINTVFCGKLSPGKCIYAVLYAALPELIPVLGLWCIHRGYTVPAVIIAAICILAVAAAVLILIYTKDSRVTVCGIAAGLLTAAACFMSPAEGLLSVILVSCCLAGMTAAAYVIGFCLELGDSMSQ